jgi:hypothetical protein
MVQVFMFLSMPQENTGGSYRGATLLKRTVGLFQTSSGNDIPHIIHPHTLLLPIIHTVFTL